MRMIIAASALLVAFSGSPVGASPTSKASEIRQWLYSQPIVRCFPELVGRTFFADRLEGGVPSAPLPRNQIPLNFRLLPAGRYLDKSAVVTQSGSEASIHVRSAAYDPSVHELALNEGFYEYGLFVILAHVENPPSGLHQQELHLKTGSIGIGSQRRDVEEQFGYGSGKRAIYVPRCGMIAESFASPPLGASMGFVFVYRDNEVIALSAGGGS